MGKLEGFDRDGFAIVEGVVSAEEVDRLVAALTAVRSGSRLERFGEVYASRNLLADLPEIRRIAESDALMGLARGVLGGGAFAVRGLLFDKTPTANWGVPWHQDLTIAIKRRAPAPGFGPWTVKGGVPHVRPPVEVLERMVTIRLHLDEAGPENGPLLVIPGFASAGTAWRLSDPGLAGQGRRPDVPGSPRRGTPDAAAAAPCVLTLGRSGSPPRHPPGIRDRDLAVRRRVA